MKRINENRNIKIGAIISYITLFVNIGTNIFYTPFLLNSVGDIKYGLWSFVLSITSWFNVAVYALYDSYVRFSTIEKKERGCENRTNTIYIKLLTWLAGIIAVIALVILILLFIGIIPLNQYTAYERKIIRILFTMSTIQVIATTILSIFKLFNEYKNNFIFVKMVVLLQVLLTTGVSTISLILKPSIIIIVFITVFFNILALFIYYFVAKIRLKMSFSNESVRENSELVKNIFSFSSILLITTIVAEINSAVDKTLLGFFAGAEMVTLYQLGMSFNVYFSELAASVNSVFIPKINKYAVNNQRSFVSELFLNISRFQTLIVTFVAGGFATCGKDFVLMWVGTTRIMAYYVGLVLLLLFSVDYSSYSSISIQRAYGKHKIPAFINLGITIVNVLISIVLLLIFPYEKSIIACLIGTAFSAIVGKWIIIPIYNKKAIGLPVGRFYKSFLLFATAALFSYGVTNLIVMVIDASCFNILWISCVTKGVIYVICYCILIIPFNYKFIKSIIIR